MMAKIQLPTPILCLVTDCSACLGRPLDQVVAIAVGAGVSMVQLRDRNASARQLLELGRSLLPIVRRAGAVLVVNDRLDVASALGADGVQLGVGSLSVRDARRVAGGMLLGVSVHSLEESVRAEMEGADYLVLGTIFETRSHPGKPPAGLPLVADVVASVGIPVVAIAGINPSNAASLMDAGASGVAVITTILSAEDVAEATRALLAAISP
jgi:thiamine-phosphate pyrophosphorylase